MNIIGSHWLPISAFLIIVAMISIATATDRQSTATDFNPDYPIGTPTILGGTGYVIETATGWHNAQDWDEYNADYSGYHPGEDWNYGSGTDDVGEPVYAIATGTVFDIRTALFNGKDGYGSGIAIKHTMPNGEEIYSVYEHIDIMSGLSIGDSVWQGDKIGNIADTTKLSPHLHFEIRTTQMDQNDWYPNDNGYGYYSSEEKLHIDGFTVDPSDFIDSHRSTAEPVETVPSSQVTLTLYVHDGRADGPIISGATVTGHDASGNSFDETTNSEGYVTIAGDQGTWSFSVSADGYEINSWDQDITITCTKHAFLQKEELKQDQIHDALLLTSVESLQSYQQPTNHSVNDIIGSWVLNYVYRGTIGSHKMIIDTINPNTGDFKGHGWYLGDPSYKWDITGVLHGNNITFHITYTGPRPDFSIDATGIFSSAVSMSGKAKDTDESTTTWSAAKALNFDRPSSNITGRWILNYKTDRVYSHKMLIETLNSNTGDFEGHGQSMDNPAIIWDIFGTVDGDNIVWHIAYTGLNPNWWTDATGTISSATFMSGNGIDRSRSGTWNATKTA